MIQLMHAVWMGSNGRERFWYGRQIIVRIESITVASLVVVCNNAFAEIFMRRRRSKEGIQSNTLMELGVGQDVPFDNFSDQPDSGGRIGGVRGKQEFGIEGGIAGEGGTEVGSRESTESRLVEEAQAASASLTEFSSEGIEQPDELEQEYQAEIDEYLAGEDLKALIEYRLEHNERIHSKDIHVSVAPSGLVTLSGHVTSEAERLRVSEVVGALPSVQAIHNKLVCVR